MTAEQFDALPEEEGRKWELLDGELIEVSSATPRHNRILGRLFKLLDSFAEARKLGAVLIETDLAVRANTRLRPDFGFFRRKHGERSISIAFPSSRLPILRLRLFRRLRQRRPFTAKLTHT